MVLDLAKELEESSEDSFLLSKGECGIVIDVDLWLLWGPLFYIRGRRVCRDVHVAQAVGLDRKQFLFFSFFVRVSKEVSVRIQSLFARGLASSFRVCIRQVGLALALTGTGQLAIASRV